MLHIHVINTLLHLDFHVVPWMAPWGHVMRHGHMVCCMGKQVEQHVRETLSAHFSCVRSPVSLFYPGTERKPSGDHMTGCAD